MLRTILVMTAEEGLRENLVRSIGQWGYLAIPVEDPAELPRMIESCNPDIVLTDGSLMNGGATQLAMLNEMHGQGRLQTEFILIEGGNCHPAHLATPRPAFVTASARGDDCDSLKAAIDSVYDRHPLPKRRSGEELSSIFDMVLSNEEATDSDISQSTEVARSLERARQLVDRPIDSLASLDQAHFHFQTLAEAEEVASAIAHICPDPVMAGLGLRELMVNAIEHGNLGITHDEKTDLVRNGLWEKEIEKRLSLPENGGKYVYLDFQRQSDRITVTIKDQGDGFDWRFYMAQINEVSDKPHGRGITIATMIAFDTVEYIGKGNEVRVMIRC